MAKSKNKKKLKTLHLTFNKKEFLAPESIRSMAAVHTKILADGTAILRVSDCNHSIRIWNDFNEQQGKEEMLDKIDMLILELDSFKREIQYRT